MARSCCRTRKARRTVERVEGLPASWPPASPGLSYRGRGVRGAGEAAGRQVGVARELLEAAFGTEGRIEIRGDISERAVVRAERGLEGNIARLVHVKRPGGSRRDV